MRGLKCPRGGAEGGDGGPMRVERGVARRWMYAERGDLWLEKTGISSGNLELSHMIEFFYAVYYTAVGCR